MDKAGKSPGTGSARPWGSCGAGTASGRAASSRSTEKADSTAWSALAQSGGLERLKVGELKGYLKERGLSQTGEKVSARVRVCWKNCGSGACV